MLQLERRRSSIEIIADILRLGEATRAEIMNAVKMSYLQVQKYLNHLLRLELLYKIESGKKSTTYRVTVKGTRLLRDMDVVNEILSGKPDQAFQ
jgi:predicted transcriptional regulator